MFLSLLADSRLGSRETAAKPRESRERIRCHVGPPAHPGSQLLMPADYYLSPLRFSFLLFFRKYKRVRIHSLEKAKGPVPNITRLLEISVSPIPQHMIASFWTAALERAHNFPFPGLQSLAVDLPSGCAHVSIFLSHRSNSTQHLHCKVVGCIFFHRLDLNLLQTFNTLKVYFRNAFSRQAYYNQKSLQISFDILTCLGVDVADDTCS